MDELTDEPHGQGWVGVGGPSAPEGIAEPTFIPGQVWDASEALLLTQGHGHTCLGQMT